MTWLKGVDNPGALPAEGQGGRCPPDFCVCPPDLFLALPLYFFLKVSIGFDFWKEKAFGIRRRPFFFEDHLFSAGKNFFSWRSPVFGRKDLFFEITCFSLNVRLNPIQKFRNKETLGQVQRWFSVLPP